MEEGVKATAVDGMTKVGIASEAVLSWCRVEDCKWVTWQVSWALAEESLRLHLLHFHKIERTTKDETKGQRSYWV